MFVEVINKKGETIKMHETTAKGCLKSGLVTLPKKEKKATEEKK